MAKRKRGQTTIERLSGMYSELAEIVFRYANIESLVTRPEGEALLRGLGSLAKKAPDRLDALLAGELGWVATLEREIKRAVNAETQERFGYRPYDDEEEPREPARVLPLTRGGDRAEVLDPDPAA